MNILNDRRGYSMTFWTVFFGFVMIPIMALGIELGRYFYARAEIAKAADAAALAAAGGDQPKDLWKPVEILNADQQDLG